MRILTHGSYAFRLRVSHIFEFHGAGVQTDSRNLQRAVSHKHSYSQPNSPKGGGFFLQEITHV